MWFLEESQACVGFQREGLYAPNASQLYTNYNVSGLEYNPNAVYVHSYAFLEDSNVLRLEFVSGFHIFTMDHIVITFYQRQKD